MRQKTLIDDICMVAEKTVFGAAAGAAGAAISGAPVVRMAIIMGFACGLFSSGRLLAEETHNYLDMKLVEAAPGLRRA